MATKLTATKRQSNTVCEKLRIIEFAEQNGNRAAERNLVFPRATLGFGKELKKSCRRCLNWSVQTEEKNLHGRSGRLISWHGLPRRETTVSLFFHPLCDWKPSNLPRTRNTTFLRDTSRPEITGVNASWRETVCLFDRKLLWHNDSPKIMRKKSSDFIGSSLIAVRNTTIHCTSSWTWMKRRLHLICHQTEQSTKQAKKLWKSAPWGMRRTE